MTKTRFTLVEMLVVIAIIAILAGIAIPGTSMAMKKARVTQAKADIARVLTAIKSYESTYHLLPVETQKTADYGTRLSDDDYDVLMQILSKIDITDNSNKKNKAATGNLRNIRFLEVDQKFPTQSLRDPWGNRYVIVFNSAYLADGIKTGKTSTNKIESKHDKLIGSVFIYSWGPNCAENNGQNTANSNEPKTDDICSWDVQ